MESWLHWLLAGAWIYAILRIEKVAYDLKKLELSQQFSYGDEGLNVRTLDITTEDCRCDHIYFPVSDGEGGYTGQECSICGKFNSAESVLRPKIDRPGIDLLKSKGAVAAPAETFLGDGDTCPECREGTLVVRKVEGCTCFINPPCHACANNPLTCDNCGHQEHP